MQRLYDVMFNVNLTLHRRLVPAGMSRVFVAVFLLNNGKYKILLLTNAAWKQNWYDIHIFSEKVACNGNQTAPQN